MRRFIFLVFVLSVVGAYLYYVRGWDLKRLNDETLGRIPIAALHSSATTTPIGARGAGTHWEEAARTLTARAESGVAIVGGKIYLMGGVDGYGRTLNSVEIYDIYTDLWSYGPKMPQALHHPAVTTDGKNIYVVGGLLGISSTPIDQAWVFDTQTKNWRETGHLNDFRGGAAAAYLDGKVYLVGGLTNAGPTASMEVLDVVLGSWKEGRTMPTPRTGLAAFAIGTKLYAVGGTNGGVEGNKTVVEVYDTDTDKWTIGAPLSAKRSDIAAAVIGNTAYVFGGESVNGTVEQVEVVDGRTGKWTTLAAPLPSPRHGLGAAVWKNRVYVIAGGRRAGFSVSSQNEVLVFGP